MTNPRVKRIAPLVVLLILSLMTYVLVQNRADGGVDPKDITFTVDNIQAIDHILMQNRAGQRIDLKRTAKERWIINDKYPVFLPFVKMFTENTLAKLAVKGPAPQAARENVIREMASTAIKVQLFEGSKEKLAYYVGGPTPDLKGTYMHIRGSETPYIAYIPGFNGYITPKFSLIEKEWYDRTVFDLSPEQIQRVQMIQTHKPEASFVVARDGDQYTLTPDHPRFSQQAAKSYMALFQFKNFEGYPEYLNEKDQDSIRSSEPLMILTVEDVNQNKRVLKVYRKAQQGINTLVDKTGHVLTYDPERYFASFTGFDELVTIQEYTFGQILATYDEFLD